MLVEFGLKIGAATLAGLFIGLEREIQNKEAGLKTNALVSLGAALFVIASLQFEGTNHDVDLTRVMGQVVTGIGFIGAGVILQQGTRVTGITTAATVWCSAGAGCFAALGLYQELALLTLLIVTINVVFRWVDVQISRKIKKGTDEEIDD